MTRGNFLAGWALDRGGGRMTGTSVETRRIVQSQWVGFVVCKLHLRKVGL